MREALGLVAFAGVFTAAGYGLLLALGGIPSRGIGLSLAGLAYATGVAGLGSVLTLEVIVGVPFGLGSVLVTAAAVVAAGVGLALRRGHSFELPQRAHPGTHVLVGAAFAGATLLVLEGAFRAMRLHGLFGFDAGAFWVPKAEAIFFTGGLDEVHFSTLPGPSYPPLVPVLQATAFTFMGDADVVTLHLAVWSILAGFALGAGALLSRLVSPVLAWGTVLLVVTATEVVDAARIPQADFTLDVFLAFAVLFLVLWLVEGRPAWLAFALVFVAGAVLTKREGLLALACIVAALLVATRSRWRETWRAAALVAGTAVLVSIPWRLWFASRSLEGDAPEAGGLGLLDHLDRLGPSLWLVVQTLLEPGHWSVLLLVAAVSVVAAVASGRREEAVFVGSFLALSVAAFTWVLWAFPSLPLTQAASLNPVVRLCGAALIPAAVCAPLLLQPALDTLRSGRARQLSARARALTVASVIGVAAAYPLAVLALDGLPRFPHPGECVDVLPRAAEPFELVYDRRTSFRAARAIHERLLANGFVGAELLTDGCGRWKVVNHDVETLEQAAGHMDDARRAGFAPRLERP